MICYKDKTFCLSDCVRKDCYRFLSEEDRKGARIWWSHDPENAPIAVADFSNDCIWYTPNDVTGREGE